MDESLVAALCSDKQWSELLEHRRGNADIFDLISVRETQHSDLLSWLFNSREGHGQGDSILRDFLVAVYDAESHERPGDRIQGHGLTKSFVQQWTPSRIMTTSFATATFFREYSLPAQGRHEKACKLDLMVVDTDNKFLVAVENKAGAKLTRAQLERYVEQLRAQLLSRSAFAKFDIAFVALDRNHDPEDEEDDDFDGRWALLNYDWLERAARRAELSQARGNRDASIVLSYSRQQINYESSNFGIINKLSRDLAIQHKDAISALRAIKRERVNPARWTPGDLDSTRLEGQMLRLLMQNRDACDLLIDLPQIELLHAKVCERDERLDEEDLVDKRRVMVVYRSFTPVPSVDELWPLHVAARHLNPDSDGQPRFRVTLVWRPNLTMPGVREDYVSRIRKQFPEARRVENRGTKLRKSDVTSIDAACKAVLEFLGDAEDALR